MSVDKDRDAYVVGGHYDLVLKSGQVISCDDVIEALGLGFRVGHAFKYLWRSARGKPGEPRNRDLSKAINHLTKELTGHWSEFGKQPGVTNDKICLKEGIDQ